MTFRELLKELETTLPEMALQLLPLSLSEKSQQKLCELEVEEAGIILKQVIEQVNSGSVETIDILTKRALENR